MIRDYTINVYIYGTSLAPEAIFTSEPPLPQEEIISLLATGTTREELTGNNNVLAGRAAMLLVQQLYRKVFKKGQGTQSSSVFDRLDLDVGTVDPRTGQQQATARFKINDQFVLAWRYRCRWRLSWHGEIFDSFPVMRRMLFCIFCVTSLAAFQARGANRGRRSRAEEKQKQQRRGRQRPGKKRAGNHAVEFSRRTGV